MWKITKDIINAKFDDPIDLRESIGCRENECVTWYPFRLLDDDGEVYFEGVSTVNDDERAFAPLDDYGMPAYGCTIIEYLSFDGKWETL